MSISPLFRSKTHEEIEQAMRTGGFSSLRFDRAKRYAAWVITGGTILFIATIMAAPLMRPAPSAEEPGSEFARMRSEPVAQTLSRYQEATTSQHLSQHEEIQPESETVTE